MINFVVVFVLFYQKIKNNTKTTTKLSHINALPAMLKQQTTQ